MKIGFLSAVSVATLAITGSAFAADMPVKAPPAPVVATWTGCYIGANGGWVQSQSRFDWLPNTGGGFGGVNVLQQFGGNDLNASGGTAGGQIGCNTQLNNWVVGFETDAQWTDIDKTLGAVFPGCAACGAGSILGPGLLVFPETFAEHVKSNWNSTTRVRLGFASGNFFFYGTGGFAVARVTFEDGLLISNNVIGTLGNFASDTRNKFGWVVGVGGEWMFAPRWSVKAEYLHLDFGNLATSSTAVVLATGVPHPEASIFHNHDLTEDMVRLGINYHFGSLFW